ncbi:MAG: hypothetical protein Q9162_006472 [Coniocarpon cinnabarinum]
MSFAAATPPVPPPHRSGVSTRHGPGASSGGGPPPDRSSKSFKPFAHLNDLVQKAETVLGDAKYIPAERLLDIADQALRSSGFYLDLERPEDAYVKYVIAYELCSSIIPICKDARSIQTSPALTERQKQLRRMNPSKQGQDLEADEHQYRALRDAIKADNRKNATQPTNRASNEPSDVRPLSLGSSSTNPPISPSPSSQRPYHHASSSEPQSSRALTHSSMQSSQLPRRVLETSAESVNGHTFLDLDSSLSDRFAKLRTSPNLHSYTSTGDQRTNSTISPVHASTSVDYTTKIDTPSLHLSAGPTTAATMKSKSIPSTSMSSTASLPKQPSPTYAPTRGSQDSARFQPPRTMRNEPRIQHQKNPSTASHLSSARPASQGSAHKTFFDDHDEDDDQDADSVSSSRGQFRRRRSMHKPQETDINAQKLFDYLSTFNVLLIDARPRSEFDSGHIYHRSIICIEPTALRRNMSAEQLQEALVLSPDSEQVFYHQRNSFDLVVYYDQSSSMSDWDRSSQKEPNAALAYLHDALLDFNQEKPLQWPPIILNGGLDSWVELLGPQGLVSSDTSSRASGRRPVSRRPVPTDTLRLDNGKRRHREYNPLDQEEVNKWKARVRSASVMLDSRPQMEGKMPAENGDDGTVSMADYEEFATRFPDVATVESQQASDGQARLESRIPQYPTPLPPTAPPPAPPSQSPQDAALPSPVPAPPPPSVPRRTYSGVQERSMAPARPPKLTEYIAPRFRLLPKIGLQNFSVTCYMNATIQCMSATVPLTAYFLQTPNIKEKFQEDNWKGSKGVLGQLYQVLLRHLWEVKDTKTLRPTNFRTMCARLNSEWGAERQQDAKEFLEFLIDYLHEDLNRHYSRNPLRPLTDEEEAHRERMSKFVVAKTEWDRSLHRDYSKLTEIFAGQHMSILQCTVCKHTSTTYEPFYSMSIEIPKAKKPLNIYDCLSSYCSAETLSGDEVWRCPRCKCEREATKRITITRVPETLVIHLKRFSASRSQSAKKITTVVDFPLERLDLGPYVLPAPSAAESAQIQNQYGPHARETPPSMKAPYHYNCYAPAVSGGMGRLHWKDERMARKDSWPLQPDAKT